MKVVINRCFGGFSLSRVAFLRLREMGNKYAKEEPDWGEMWPDGSGPRQELFDMFLNRIPRNDPDLIKIIQEMGEKANGHAAELAIIEIPDGVEWEIDEYDGSEKVEEKHRSWS